MYALTMLQKLKEAGVSFASGMTEMELARAEEVFDFRFPKEIREFLACGVPVGKDFFNYRDLSAENQKEFHNFQQWIEKHFRFDLANNREEMRALLDEHLGYPADFDAAVLAYFHSSVKLIPFFAHRCFFDGMDGMPIISFWQPTDMIIYGLNFSHYLEEEFLEKSHDRFPLPENLPEKLGIWKILLLNG